MRAAPDPTISGKRYSPVAPEYCQKSIPLRLATSSKRVALFGAADLHEIERQSRGMRGRTPRPDFTWLQESHGCDMVSNSLREAFRRKSLHSQRLHHLRFRKL